MGRFYEGDFEGMHWQSLYPNLYRVTYTWVNPISHREVNSRRVISASNEFAARDHVTRRAHVRGDIQVELVHSLMEVK